MRERLRDIFHTVVAVLMWVLFGYYWYVVGQRTLNPSTVHSALALGALVVVGSLLTLAWVVHNLRLSRRFARRKAFPAPPEEFEADVLARPVVAPPVDDLRGAKIVSVVLDDEGRKIYAVSGEVAD